MAHGKGGVGSGSGGSWGGRGVQKAPRPARVWGRGGGEDSGQEGPSRKIWGVGAELGFLWGTQGCGGSRTRSDARASVHSF